MLISELMKDLESESFQLKARSYVSDDVFITRIHELEGKYEMRWFEFECKFVEQKLKPKSDEERLDYAEWHMLCSEFLEQLDEPLINSLARSPGVSECTYSNEGPSDRAFTIW